MFKDFGVTGISTTSDPAISYTRGGSFVTSGVVDGPWTRPHLTFVPDRDSKFVSVGARVLAMNVSTVGSEHLNAQYFTNWQMERAQSSGAPRDYSPAREIQVVVKPDRLNLVPSPTGTTLTGWTFNGMSVVADALARTGQAARLTTAGSQFSYAYTDIAVKPGDKITTSVMIRTSTLTQPWTLAAMQWHTAAMAALYTSGTVTSTQTANWTRVSYTGTAPSTAAFVRLFPAWSSSNLNSDQVFWHDMITTRGDEVVAYFDGSFGEDYLWEGTVNNSRSYFYENRLDRGEALIRALRDVVPQGIGVGTPQFAVFTG